VVNQLCPYDLWIVLGFHTIVQEEQEPVGRGIERLGPFLLWKMGNNVMPGEGSREHGQAL
jgi:hypothetical protein